MTLRLRFGAGLVLAGVVAGVVLLGIAMEVYPGGTAIDPHTRGHSFWLNLLCDLTEQHARNGEPNTGALVARAGMVTLSAALGVHWLILPAFMRGRAVGWVVRVAGVLQVVALMFVPFATRLAHPLAIFTSAAAGLVAGIVALVALVRADGPAWRWALPVAVLAATAVDAVFYARSVATSPRVVTPALPIFQRVGGLLILAWLIAVAVEILARGRGGRAAPLGSAS
ncbi:MAG TPA: hypothetical protein VHK47_14800 [Polyangia bacterium]|nr:hypothetical protein [Polyangia bacterium]